MSTTAKFHTLEINENLATVTITREDAMNALNEVVITELGETFDGLANNADVRSVFLRGAGNKAFVAGADITELAAHSAEESAEFMNLGHRVMARIATLGCPTVALVQGFCLGGGMELALACDFVVAGPRAKFGLPETKLGLLPGFGGSQRLTRRIGISRAKDMIFTGRMVGVDEALNWGLVNRISDDGEDLATVAKELIAPMLDNGPCAIALAKTALDGGMDGSLEEGLALEKECFAKAHATSDAKEGLNAFMNKRKAEFKGV